MRIVMLATVATMEGSFCRWREYDVSQDVGRDFIRARLATEVEPAAAAAEPEPAHEVMDQTPAEEVLDQRPSEEAIDQRPAEETADQTADAGLFKGRGKKRRKA